MSRKGRIAKRDVLPDPIYNSKTITKLINNIMLDGKKGVAQNILYEAFKKLKKRLESQLWKYSTQLSTTSCLYLN